MLLSHDSPVPAVADCIRYAFGCGLDSCQVANCLSALVRGRGGVGGGRLLAGLLAGCIWVAERMEESVGTPCTPCGELTGGYRAGAPPVYPPAHPPTHSSTAAAAATMCRSSCYMHSWTPSWDPEANGQSGRPRCHPGYRRGLCGHCHCGCRANARCFLRPRPHPTQPRTPPLQQPLVVPLLPKREHCSAAHPQSHLHMGIAVPLPPLGGLILAHTHTPPPPPGRCLGPTGAIFRAIEAGVRVLAAWQQHLAAAERDLLVCLCLDVAFPECGGAMDSGDAIEATRAALSTLAGMLDEPCELPAVPDP